MSCETLRSPVARIPTPPLSPLSAMLRSSLFPIISLSPLPGSSCRITRMMRPPTSTEPERKVSMLICVTESLTKDHDTFKVSGDYDKGTNLPEMIDEELLQLQDSSSIRFLVRITTTTTTPTCRRYSKRL
ncbi:hypothetical protein OPV22_031472 [Ensete ventricosum]|uniref:Kinesin motor domain-containing protein n=1 Tax=Ensete ventricosum TaxID=4639 RepID=A0AAV8NZB2_ENSVE|nr:hypothetical protein OPV22_031472 [Ensete ventricosum]